MEMLQGPVNIASAFTGSTVVALDLRAHSVQNALAWPKYHWQAGFQYPLVCLQGDSATQGHAAIARPSLWGLWQQYSKRRKELGLASPAWIVASPVTQVPLGACFCRLEG